MIIILCGPPASGKTTLATRLQERLADRGHAFEILHSDDFSRRTYEQMYHRVADSDANWILDGTFYSRELQERFRALGDAYLVWVRASIESALERNRTRDDAISERGLHSMYAKFEPPREDLDIDTNELSVDEATDHLESAVLSWLNGNKT